MNKNKRFIPDGFFFGMRNKSCFVGKRFFWGKSRPPPLVRWRALSLRSGQEQKSIHPKKGHHLGIVVDLKLVGGCTIFLFPPLLGEDSHFDSYFFKGLKPPTS